MADIIRTITTIDITRTALTDMVIGDIIENVELRDIALHLHLAGRAQIPRRSAAHDWWRDPVARCATLSAGSCVMR
jgi:hypothetical protein